MTGERIDVDAAPAVKDAVTWVELDGEAVLYDEDTAAMHLLDPIATSVWALFDGSTPLRQICRDLADEFGADEEVVRRDVLGLVRQFHEQGLLAHPNPSDKDSDGDPSVGGSGAARST